MKQLAEFWAGLSTARRAALLVVTLSVLGAVLAIAVLGSRVEYAYLYTNLDQKDAAAIAQKLAELQVPYQVGADGSSLKVPRDQVHSLRLEIANSGLPRGGAIGNEIFDESRLGATEFEQQVNLRRALEGELARSIMTIDGVDHARVHLVLPKNRLFAAKSEGASASVIVRLRNRHAFGRQEVAGIVHLVATAVPNLTHERVSVVDSNGVTLHSPQTDDALSPLGTGSQTTEAARAAEVAIENRVRTLLERTTGPGAVDVRVKLDLDPSTRERTEEHFEPTSTALRSEHKSEELTGTEGATVAGVPGAQTNLPDVEPSAEGREGRAGGNVLQRTRTRNWEIDRVVEKILTPAGDVQRLSVAVLVDGRYEEKEGQRIYSPRSPDELAALKSTVEGAVGFEPRRGDRIELHAVRFAQPEIGEREATPPEPRWMKYVPYALAAGGALFALSLLVLIARGRKARKQRKELELAKLQLAESEQTARAKAEARLIEDPEEQAEREAEAVLERRTQALEIASKDPVTAAVVLREWLEISSSAKELPEKHG